MTYSTWYNMYAFLYECCREKTAQALQEYVDVKKENWLAGYPPGITYGYLLDQVGTLIVRERIRGSGTIILNGTTYSDLDITRTQWGFKADSAQGPYAQHQGNNEVWWTEADKRVFAIVVGSPKKESKIDVCCNSNNLFQDLGNLPIVFDEVIGQLSMEGLIRKVKGSNNNKDEIDLFLTLRGWDYFSLHKNCGLDKDIDELDRKLVKVEETYRYKPYEAADLASDLRAPFVSIVQKAMQEYSSVAQSNEQTAKLLRELNAESIEAGTAIQKATEILNLLQPQARGEGDLERKNWKCLIKGLGSSIKQVKHIEETIRQILDVGIMLGSDTHADIKGVMQLSSSVKVNIHIRLMRSISTLRSILITIQRVREDKKKNDPTQQNPDS